jgi:uncharacterized protein (DUF433 family)
MNPSSMTFTSDRPALGIGLYSVSDVKALLKLPSDRVRYFFNIYFQSYFSKQTFHNYVFDLNGVKTISFLSFIEIYVFYALDKSGVSRKNILEAHDVLSIALKTPHPFATRGIFTDGGSVFFGDDKPTITADKRLQHVMSEILDPFCKKIEFGSGSTLAEKFYPMGKNSSVVVNPKNKFGRATIDGTNVLPEVVFDAYVGGDSIKIIENSYLLTTKQVEDAIEYIERNAA